MIRNYLVITFRNIFRKKFYSLINIVGLSIGISASLLILLYVSDEMSYDRFHKNAKDIYRVYLKAKVFDQEFYGYAACNPLGPAGKDEIPEIRDYCRVARWTDIIVKYGDVSFTEKYMYLADSNFFKFFSYKLIQGDPENVLREPNSIVLTEKLARKYFNYQGKGDTSVVGKMINIGTGEWLHKITGIAENPPHNTHMRFDFIMSINSWDYMKQNVWLSNNHVTYFLLDKNAGELEVEGKIEEMVLKHIGPEVQQLFGISFEEMGSKGGAYGYFLTPLLKLHLNPDAPELIFDPHGDVKYVYIFAAIAIFILLIACINFMNLSTAQSASRAKEVGIRKTVGARRQVLIGQFLMESMIFSLISMILAILATYFILPLFNQVSGKELTILSVFTSRRLVFLILLIILVGLMAGSYPAFYLTIFKPAEVLRGKIKAGLKSSGIRSGLVVVQFSISIILIICTLIVYNQLNHLQKKKLGFNKENMLVISNSWSLGDNRQAFIQELNDLAGVENVAMSNQTPPSPGSMSVFKPVGPDKQDIMMNYYSSDYDFKDTYGLEMAEGRFFSRDFPSDSSAMVINEAAKELIGWEDPIGRKIITYDRSEKGTEVEIVGVMKNFNFETLKNEIKPMALLFADWGNIMTVRIHSGDTQGLIKTLEKKWKEYGTGKPFDYVFLDEIFDATFRQEQRLGKIFLGFTILAIFIACLGLFGLATFTSEQRAKEIGIRKSMGATVGNVVLLLSKDYILLVIISFIISVPVSWYAMYQWLQNFAYRVNVEFVIFIFAGLGALLIAWLTVSYQSIRAASANPVNSLRYE